MQIDKALPQLIKEIIEHHKDALWNSNVKTATDIEAFEKWCDITAKQHVVITLKYLFTEEEFKTLENESAKLNANRVD